MTVVDPAAIIQASMTKMKLNNVEAARKRIMDTEDPTVISNKTGVIIDTYHNRKYHMVASSSRCSLSANS